MLYGGADVAARREARRKRILENSLNRLQLISGKCNDECPRESPIRTIIPEPIHEISVSSTHESSCNNAYLNNGVILPESESFDLLSFDHEIANHDIAAGDGELPDLSAFIIPAQEQFLTPQSQSSIWEKLTNYKYDLVMLSILIQLLCNLLWITFEDTYFFLPVLIYSITKMIWFPSQSTSKFSSALMLLQGMSSYKVQKILYLLQCLSVLSCDICIFLFTTICIQSLVITLKDALIT